MNCCVFCSLHKSSRINVRDLWTMDENGLFHQAMSHNQFFFLLRCVRLLQSYIKLQEEIYKLAPIREIFETFVKNWQNCCTLEEYVLIDEKRYVFKGKCTSRQYKV